MIKLSEQAKKLPHKPGVYFFRDKAGKIIYIGKASSLKNRVSSYFVGLHDPKTTVMVANIARLDTIEVKSEVEALFLESELIKRHQPKFNVEQKDEKSYIYVKFTNQEYPAVEIVRRPVDDGAEYFGPFVNVAPIRTTLEYLRRIFPYSTHINLPKRPCLQYHLGLCPGPETRAITPAEYRKNLIKIRSLIKGKQKWVIEQLKKEMKKASVSQNYELAAKIRDRMNGVMELNQKVLFGQIEARELKKDQALTGLTDLLKLNGLPRRIEAFDISNIQGTEITASMVVMIDGLPKKDEYRKFKIRTVKGQDDFASMREVIRRRLGKLNEWGIPELIIIDGGKGQLSSALSVMNELGIKIPTVGLAKREEEVIKQETSNSGQTSYRIIRLPHSSETLQLLQRIRDEAHRFAVIYHSLLRSKKQTKSAIDDLVGIGSETRKKLIKAFGSLKGVREASENEVAEVIGSSKAKIVKSNL